MFSICVWSAFDMYFDVSFLIAEFALIMLFLVTGFAGFDGSFTKYGKVQKSDQSRECSSTSGQFKSK